MNRRQLLLGIVATPALVAIAPLAQTKVIDPTWDPGPSDAMRFCGPWRAQAVYHPNDVVHFGGMMWVCLSPMVHQDNFSGQDWGRMVSDE